MEGTTRVKVKDVFGQLGKLSTDEIRKFVSESVIPEKVPADSIVRQVVEKIYGEYSISRMIIVKSYIADILLGRDINTEN